MLLLTNVLRRVAICMRKAQLPCQVKSERTAMDAMQSKTFGAHLLGDATDSVLGDQLCQLGAELSRNLFWNTK